MMLLVFFCVQVDEEAVLFSSSWWMIVDALMARRGCSISGNNIMLRNFQNYILYDFRAQSFSAYIVTGIKYGIFQ